MVQAAIALRLGAAALTRLFWGQTLLNSQPCGRRSYRTSNKIRKYEGKGKEKDLDEVSHPLRIR